MKAVRGKVALASVVPHNVGTEVELTISKDKSQLTTIKKVNTTFGVHQYLLTYNDERGNLKDHWFSHERVK